MERYEIWRGKTCYAEYCEGDPSRFGRPFCRTVALEELDSYREHCRVKGIRGDCELRIILESNVLLSGVQK